MAKKKSARRDVPAASEPSVEEIRNKSNYFLRCLRKVSFFLNINAHILELHEIQEDLSGLDDLSDALEEIQRNA